MRANHEPAPLAGGPAWKAFSDAFLAYDAAPSAAGLREVTATYRAFLQERDAMMESGPLEQAVLRFVCSIAGDPDDTVARAAEIAAAREMSDFAAALLRQGVTLLQGGCDDKPAS